MAIDLLSNALNTVKVAELKGKSTCVVPNSKLIRSVLNCLKDNGYLQEIEENGNGRQLNLKLKGSVNNCGAVKPRFFVKQTEWEKYETRFLPSKAVGLLIVSTSNGVMTQEQAKQKHLGGALLAFVY